MARLAQKLFTRKELNADPIVQKLLHHKDIKSQRDCTDVDFNHIIQCARNVMPKPKKRGDLQNSVSTLLQHAYIVLKLPHC